MAQLDATRGMIRPAAPAADVSRLRGWEIGLLNILMICIGLGSTWDVKWHYAIGRDSFWIPPHLILYVSVALIGLISAGGVLYETWRVQPAPGGAGVAAPGPVTGHFLGFSGPPGLFISGFGVLTMLLAAPFDDWWHRMYGIDVTIWSLPHMAGVLGGGIAALGGLVTAVHERRARRGRWASLAVLLFLMALLGNSAFALIPAIKLSFWPHGYSPAREPFADNLLFYPLLGSLLLAYPLVAAARLFAGRRAWLAPLGVLALFVLLNALQTVTAYLGFAAFVPWGDQTLARSPVGVERALWDHPILLVLPTLALALVIYAARGRRFERAALLAGAAFGLALMLETLPVFVSRNPRDRLDLGTVALGLALAPVLGALSAAFGALVGRWLRGRASQTAN